MIDNPLQKKYRKVINNVWTEKQADEILIDFYKNLQIESNRKNLNQIFNEISKNNLKNLSRKRELGSIIKKTFCNYRII